MTNDAKQDWKALFRRSGRKGGLNAAKALGPDGRRERALKGWETKRAKREKMREPGR